ncbi:alcohol dehydrogenase catalytic domain-containing protein [Solirubrobacter ginsenosidimutans]|uniref:Alcohol dehydrogenase catalytic domain-containing protein n=1 Tax=Solirubrobacter ginsenosidimutans TaxID=490573 RepID=A0A9X3S1W5_9ACTN|nr:alcohol dehydrogenase catalytic domain-containing protein [Solirubrobacter ginsenosidimutans]MDA0161552.1 alcohol dehydrogenase catalytic domain-containing protein [Solirubrobacter ginsenosidimutans]
MRAAVLHGPGDLRIEDVAEPVAGPGEIVLAIGAATSCATDVKSVKRGHPSIAGYPARLGHEFAGTVESVGEGVTTVAAGDVVFCANSAPCGVCHQCVRGRESLCEDLLYLLGGFAEKLLIPERVVAKNLHRLPAGVPLALAPLAEPLACAVHALDAVDLRAGDPVAILGGGSLGLMLAALVASAGGAPIVLDPHPERLAQATRFGAAETILATRASADAQRVRGLTAGRGAELVVEAVGRPESWELAVAMAAPGGTVNLFGGCARDSTFTVPTARVHYEEVTLLGTYHHAPRYLAHALEVLAAAEHPWHELLGPEITLDELPAALAGRLHDPVPAKYSVSTRTAP